jgi:putative transcriptional regulator
MDSLRGNLLIASPALIDPNFHRTVILIAEHTGEGAMGLVLNRPAETLVADVVPDLSDLAEDDAPVYFGGPVASDSVIVLAEFDDPSLAGVLLEGDLGFVASATGDIGEAGRGVRRARIYAGHSGWGPGQLEAELEEESWIVEPLPQREEIFSEDAEGLWAAVLRRKGREYALLSTMPPDPSVN